MMSFQRDGHVGEGRQSDDELLLLGILRDLCNASSNDARTVAAAQLREAVENLAEDSASPGSNNPAITTLNNKLQLLLKSSRKEERLAAIGVIRHLFRGEAETLDNRVQRAFNAFRTLFHTDVTDMDTAKAAARLAADLSSCNKSICDDTVNYLLHCSLDHLSTRPPGSSSSTDSTKCAETRAVSAMVVAELSVYVPEFVFRKRGKIRVALWQVVLDEARIVRENAVRAMQALLDNVVDRASEVDSTSAVEDILQEMLAVMPPAMSPLQNPTPKLTDILHVSEKPAWNLHGILLLLASLIQGEKTCDNVRKYFTELCKHIVPLQRCADPYVREAVAFVLPEIVKLRKDAFVSKNFLNIVFRTTMALVQSSRLPGIDKGRSLEALGKIANEVGGLAFESYLGDVLTYCELHLAKMQEGPSCVPQNYVLSCIMYLAKCSHGSRTFEYKMRRGLLENIFEATFTHELVLAVCEIQRAVPSLAEAVEFRLINIIATTLRQGQLQFRERNGNLSRHRIGVPNKLGMMMGKGGLDPGNALQAANVIDDVFQGSIEETASNQLFSQTAYVYMLHNMGSGSDAAHIGSYGSSFESHSLVIKDSSFQSFLQDRRCHKDANEQVVNLDMVSDKAQSPCVALRAIEHYTIFKMKPGDISLFTKQFVLDYLDYENVKVRFLAVLSCAKLTQTAVKSWNEFQRKGGGARRLRPDIQKIISMIVSLSVADPSPEVRTTALSVLQDKEDFHPYIVQPNILKKLFLCLYDEHIGVRLRSLTLAGRLSRKNPAHVVIPLRKFLAYILNVLRTKGDFLSGLRKECTHLLQVFIQDARHVVDYFADGVLEAVISRLHCARVLNDRNSAKPVLIAIGELGGISSRINLSNYCDQLAPVIVSYILDDTSVDSGFCKLAIHALLKLVQCTGYVIQPYEKFERLLPGLLRLLGNEVDPTVRLEIETLLGCLGAVDPSNHRDASLPSLAGSLHVQSRVKNEQASRFRRMRSRVVNGTSLPPSVDGFSYAEDAFGNARNKSTMLQAVAPPNPEFPDALHVPVVSVDLFAVGPEKLKRIIRGYVPIWSKTEHKEVSLVGRLEHPFTASKDYFPSVALDRLLSLARNANKKQQHREVFVATIKILKDYRERSFLDVVYPCLLWVLRPEKSAGAKLSSFSGFQDFVMARLTELVETGREAFSPYVFDTILLIIQYIKDTRFSPKCIVAVCKLLRTIRSAIGDASFTPIVSTILSLLLEALSEDHRCSVLIAEAVLSTIQSFGSMLKDSSAIVIGTVVNVVETADNPVVRHCALRTLLSLLYDVPLDGTISVVLHPLMRLLANSGEFETGFSANEVIETHDTSFVQTVSFTNLSDGAAEAIAIIAFRIPETFDVFAPVVAKALKANFVGGSEDLGKRELRAMLLRNHTKVAASVFGYSSSQVKHILSTRDPRSVRPWAHVGSNVDSSTDSEEELPANGNPEAPEEGIEPAPQNNSEADLLRMFRIRDNFSAEEWERWRMNLEIGLIKHSGSASIRDCLFMFDNNANVARSLFNAAFLSCWSQPEDGIPLSVDAQISITNVLLHALQSETMPLNVTQLILNLFEYMEHDERPLPASVNFLAERACRCGAFAKALRYKEGEYGVAAKPIGGCPKLARELLNGDHGLLAIYDKLGHRESAKGTIHHYKKIFGTPYNEHVDEKQENCSKENGDLKVWAARLGQWDDFCESAPVESDEDLDKYSAFQVLREDSVTSPRWSYLLRKLQSLNDLGEWRATNDLVKHAWAGCKGNDFGRQKLAVEGKGISVAFDLSHWKEFEERMQYLSEDPFLNAFYKTLHLVHHGRENPELLDEAENNLNFARRQLDIQLTARLNEGYPRAYLDVVHAQTLVELEEMISYLRLVPEMKILNHVRIRHMWKDRLDGCKYDQYIWYRVLMIRALVLPPEESRDQWIEFSALCRKSNRMPLASEALRMLVSPNLSQLAEAHRSHLSVEDMTVTELKGIPDLETRYAVCKHLWRMKKRTEAYEVLKSSADEYRQAAESWKTTCPVFCYSSSLEPEAESKRAEVVLATEVLLKIGKWSFRLASGSEDVDASHEMAIDYARQAAQMRQNFSKPWHWWAKFNYEHAKLIMESAAVIAPGPSSTMSRRRPVLTKEAKSYLTSAVTGYFNAIRFGGRTSLEDSLKILTMWFKYGSVAQMHIHFDKGFEHSPVTGWLEVIPQIIARLHSSSRNVQAGIEQLLVRIGNEHPQMAVYNLIVAKTTPGPHKHRRTAAEQVLECIKRKHYNIVSQAEMVAHELVRVAVLWSEMWYETLDEASRLYFGERDIDAMIQCVRPLHAMLAKGAQTTYEKGFVELYGRELNGAADHLARLIEGRRRGLGYGELQQICTNLWEMYYYVYGRLQSHQKLINALDLSKVSQHLKHSSDLELAVPGTYQPSETEVVSIQSFSAHLRIIQSKQRPRKLSILGSDGHQYDFLLKGHEDLRQDERVMQVFGLINQILSRSHIRSLRSGCDIKRYAVVALSSNAGLIEWVPNCDTMHALVKDHRESRKIMPNIEHKVMTRVAPEPDRLPLLCRVDIFNFMLENTSGADISRVLWLKSRSSEAWLDRRTTYALSLASSSMAGYLLGLGDRHPSNLMIDRTSGKIMHIDFGDCFEVAQARDKYPEKVPFRLTRMLVNALEPCGVEGYFRHTCEAVMRVLRNEETAGSLMCMMEAFVHDPLLRMKLVGGEELQRLKQDADRDLTSAVDQILDDTAPPLLSESLRNERSAAFMALMETQSLEAAHLQQQLLQNEHQGQEEPIAGEMEVPGAGQNTQDQAPMHAPSPFIRSRRDRDRLLNIVPQDKCAAVADERAAIALQRVKAKLNGMDFDNDDPLNVEEQVDKLIAEAQSVENLCSLYVGWCSFW